MAPKSTNTQIDAKLAQLRKFVEENLATLAQRRGTTLAKSMRQNQSADERRWYMFLSKKATDFTAEQSDHITQTFDLLGTQSNDETPSSSIEVMDSLSSADASSSTKKIMTPSRSGVLPPTENTSATASSNTRGSNVSAHSGATPPTDNASATASSYTQASITRYDAKRRVSGHIKQNADTIVSDSKRKKSEHEKEETTSGSKAPTMKRKSPASTPTTSGEIPPTQRARTREADETIETNKNILTIDNWTQLHEFDAWLETPHAMGTRRDQIDMDRQLVKNLLQYPPTRATLQWTGSRLHIKRMCESFVSWHYRCVQEALHHYRFWRRGGFTDWRRTGPQPGAPDTMDACSTHVETVVDMGHRHNYWWTTELTRSFRRLTVLRTKHPQLLDNDKWETIENRLGLAMKSAGNKMCNQLFRKHKEFSREAAVYGGHRVPMIATPECSTEASTVKPPTKRHASVPALVSHYHFCCFLVNQVDGLQTRSEEVDAMTETPGTVGAKPPDEKIPTASEHTDTLGAQQADMGPIGAKPPEHQSAHEVQLSASAPPNTAKKAIPQPIISRSHRQSQRDFLDKCRSSPCDLPYYAFQGQAETLKAETSQDLRHLALIDMKGCTYQQLPIKNSQLFRVAQKNAESASHGLETELEYVQAAQQRLHEFAIDPSNAYAGIRFLNMQRSDAKAVQAATEKIVEDLLKFLTDNELGHVWAAWHPHRFAAVSVFMRLFLADPTHTASQWNWMVEPKRTYIPRDQIHSLPMLASHCPSLPETIGTDAVPPRVGVVDTVPPRVAEAASQAIATPPVVCELCHKGFRCKEDLIHHCKRIHGNFAEYRKHVFWKAEGYGLQPQTAWQKRSILNSHAFFHRYSVPGAFVNDHCRSIDKAVPRRMEACAICAVKDWIERRTQMHLFAKPDGRKYQAGNGLTEQNEEDTKDEPGGVTPPAGASFYHTKNNILCIGHPDKVDQFLGVQHYIAAWPKIPIEELHASSVQHPQHSNMRWLLHSRRVPKDAAQSDSSAPSDQLTTSQETERGVPSPVRAPRCAGVGKEDETVWACFPCARSLAGNTPHMPELALANGMWLGRVHHLYRNLTLAMRLLLGLGRPMMRSLYLGRGPRDEVHRGLQGNTMIVAQPSAMYKQVVPDVSHALSGLTVMFCKSVEDVSKAHVLTVQPEQYVPAMRRRILVCPTFENVQLDEEAVTRDLPADAVPAAIIEHAVAMPETATMRTTMDGPASRHSQFGPNPEEEADTDEDDNGDNDNTTATNAPTDVDTQACIAERTNDFETVIGVDTASEEPEVHLFTTMQNKLELLTAEGQKLAKAASRAASAACHHLLSTTCKSGFENVPAPTTEVATQEQCKRIVVDLQEIVRKLGKSNPQRLEALVTGHAHPNVEALAIPSGVPMSTYHAATLPAAYVEFQFGDCTPFIDRQKKIACKQIFAALPCREELEYHLESDDPTDPYTAPARSRFDDPELIALFADILRRMTTSQSVSAALRREGFQQDEKAIASVSSEQLLQMTVGMAEEPCNHAREGGAGQPHTKTPVAVEKALRNLMFSTATVPLTDGYKMRLRHTGHAMNILFGPLTTFSTHNFPDNYSPLLRVLCEGHGAMPQEEEPTMPTLQQMHRMTAASPASTAAFWLLRQELAFRHFYGMDQMHIGGHYLRSIDSRALREDNLASSGTAGLSGFSESSLCPGEAQARGFEHGHDKKTSIPKGHHIQYQDLKSMCAQPGQQATAQEQTECGGSGAMPPAIHQPPGASTSSDAPPLANQEAQMLSAMELYNQGLIPYVTTRQYESSTLPGKQFGLTLPPSPFSARQQQQSRYDGQYEADNTTQRELVPIVEQEPSAHIARETRRAAAGSRPPANAYSHVPLTGNALTLLPAYQLTQNIGEPYRIIRHGELTEEIEHRRATTLEDACCFAEDGAFQHFLVPCGDMGERRKATSEDLSNDARRYEEAYAHDFRWLSGYSHDHTCAATCVKKMKKSTMEEKQKVLKSNRAPPCRFWFLHVVAFALWNGTKEVMKRVRRRGKGIVVEPTICNTNEHNEYGLVEPERPQPFRSPTSDVMCNGDRGNDDFRIMARGYPMGENIEKHVNCDAGSLARCFPDIPFKDISQATARRMAYSVLALHVAAHNCDYYIVKYQCKSLEQLQNLITQYAIGIQRLEAEEQETLASGADKWTSKERARKVTIKLQSAANRCHWFSSTELAVFLQTGGTCWMSHNETPVFLSKIIYMMHACRRRLEDRSPGLIEAANVKLDVMEFQTRPKAGAPPPSDSNRTVTHAPEQDWPTDSAKGNEREARVAAEPAEDESDCSPGTTTGNERETRAATEPAEDNSDFSSDITTSMDRSSSDDEGPHGQHDRDADPPPHSDVQPLAQAGNLETGSTDQSDDSDYLPSNPFTSSDEEASEEETYQPVRLHATTSRFDDWLHRGPWLHSLPYFVYMHNIKRVQKSQASPASKQASQRFAFDTHYPLSTLYQQEMDQGVIPRLVGTQCQQHEDNQGEDYAIWHLATFGLARCPGTGCCCEVTMFKHMLTPKKSFRFPETSLPSLGHSYCPAWTTRLQELKRLSEQGRTKVKAAERIPTIFDTSLVKHWTAKLAEPADKTENIELPCHHAASSEQREEITLPCHHAEDNTLERITILQLTISSLKQWQGEVFSIICTYMNVTPGYHHHQLHLEEYAAIRCMEAISNINFQLLVAKKPFKVEAVTTERDSDGDDDLLPNNDSRWKEAECLGGDQDDDIEDEEFSTETIQRSKVHVDLDRCRQMLSRKEEIERARAPGRHKEAETHMKNYPEFLQAVNSQNLPPIPQNKTSETTCFATALHNNDLAAKHQAAMKIILRSQSNADTTNTDAPPEFNEDAWRAMLQRNTEKNKPKCQTVAIDDMAQGPGHVAWKFILACRDEEPPIVFNEEQLDCMALQIWDIEKAFRDRHGGATSPAVLPDSHVLVGGQTEAIRSKYLLPNDLGLPRALVAGGGGCGKTTMLDMVICPTYETYFERTDRATPSNKSARLFKAKTVHSLNGFRPSDSLRTVNIRIKTDTMRKRTQAVHSKSGALFIDEYGQLQTTLWHANNLLWTIARQPKYNLKIEHYARPRETAGRISKLLLSGDHLQLPPVPKSTSLLADIEGTSDEHKAGAAMFASIEQVFELETMMRFKDPVLRKILEKMRTPGGTRLTDAEWRALMATNAEAATMDTAARQQLMTKTRDWYHSCYLWCIVNLAAYTSAKLTAKSSYHTLFYLQAVDSPKVPPRHTTPSNPETGALPPETVQLYEKMLQISSLSATRRLPGWACFHQEQRIRLTTSVLVPYAVQDSTGKIKYISLHPVDQRALRGVPPPAEYKLEYPPTLYIKLDGVEHEFLPPIPCADHSDMNHIDIEHRDSIYQTCTRCQTFPGLIQVRPEKVTWYYTDDKIQYASSVDRIQLPILPEQTCPLYGLQGSTADPGLWAHWNMPGRMDPEVKWLLVYVMLSRVRGLDCLVSSGLNDKIRDIIESGPPETLVGNFKKLFGHKIQATRRDASEARKNLGWSLPGER